MSRFSNIRRILAMSLAATLCFSVLAPGASAELNDQADAGIWGVVDRLAVGVEDDKEVVRAIEIIGDRVFVGGFFLKVQDPDAGTNIRQPFLAAYNRQNGDWISTFSPDLDGPVLALASSEDGSRLLVGGDFTSIDGDTRAAGIASIDPRTGALQTGWRSTATWDYAQGRLSVDALHRRGDSLYIGGQFSHITDSDGVKRYRSNLARVTISTGFLDGWRPEVRDGRVTSITTAPNNDRVYVAGQFEGITGVDEAFRFASLDVAEGPASGTAGVAQGTRVYDQLWTTSQALNGTFQRGDHPPFDIEAWDGYVAWVGDQTIEVLNARDLSHVWTWSRASAERGCEPDGDVQAVEFLDGWLYFGGHFTTDNSKCQNAPHLISRWRPATGWDRDFHRSFSYSAPSIWELERDGDGLFVGGNFSWAGGEHAASVARFSSSSQDQVRPSTPKSLKISDKTASSLTLAWNASTDNVGVRDYQVRNADTNAVITTTTSPTATVSNLALGTSHRFYVRARDAAGNLSWRSNITSGAPSGDDAVRPSTPKAFAAVSASATSASLTWKASTDNVAVGGYRVFDGATHQLVKEVSGTSTTLTGLATDVTRQFYVRAKDTTGNLSWRSNIDSATPGGAGGAPIMTDTERPKAPKGFKAVAVRARQIDVTWNAATDNIAVTGYRIYDADTGATVTNTRGTTTTLANLTSGRTYKLYVKAIDGSGNISWRSNLITVTTK